MKRPDRILVTCCESRNAFGAVRSLAAAGWRVTAAGHAARVAAALGSRPDLAEVIHAPDPWQESKRYAEWLRARLVSFPDEWILPGNEGALFAANQIRQETLDHHRFVMPSAQSLAFALSKYEATFAAGKAGVRIPATAFLRPPGGKELCRNLGTMAWPVLIKWDNHPSGGKYVKGGASVAMDASHAMDILAELEPSSCGVIAQKIVPGHGVGAFFLRHRGKIMLRFAHRRLHEVPWPGGVSSLCESSDDQEVLEAGERLLEAIDYEGVAMVEFRKQPGKPPVFLEINGRLWGSLGLALAAGADFPRAMVECHLNSATEVKQPVLSRRLLWHDPGLQMDYLRSLWTRAPGPVDGPVPRWTGTLRVVGCFLDPRVRSDWWEWGQPFAGLKRYARLWRREMAWLKAQLLQCLKSRGPHPLVAAAAERTVEWSKKPSRPENILFLCYGNILRSPYSEKRWNAWRQMHPELPPAVSVGFHDNADRETPGRFKSAAGHRGVDLSEHRSRRVTAADVAEASVIFAMDLRNLGDMQREFPEALGKMLLLGALGEGEDPEIPDPYGQPIGAGGAAYRRIDSCLERMRHLLGSSA